MTDDPAAAARAPSEEPAGTPAEAQFPYAATHGLQPAAPPTSLRRRRPGRRSPVPLVALGAALFALAVTAAYLLWGPQPDPRSPAAASRLVRGYLDALANGDAAAAMKFTEEPPSDPSLLTAQTLAAQQKTAPLNRVTVQDPDEPGRVPVSYRLGAEPVSAVYKLTLHDHGWVLDRVAAEVDLSGFAVPVAINGVTPESLRPSLFPGQYRITSRSPRYELADDDFTVAHPFASPALDTRVELSEAGRAEVIAAAERQLANCLGHQDLDPPGCGFNVADPPQTDLDDSTVTWSVTGPADLSTTEVALDHAGSASADVDLVIRGEIDGVDGSQWKVDVRLTRLRADLTGPVVEVQFG